MRTSENTTALFSALEKAQAAIEPVKKTKTATVQTKSGKNYKYSYAHLAAVKEASKSALIENELVLIQSPGVEGLVTRLFHKPSNQWLEGTIPWQGNSGPQDLGGEITFFRRYARTTILDMETEDDDAGEAQRAYVPSGGPVVRPVPSSSQPPTVPQRRPRPQNDRFTHPHTHSQAVQNRSDEGGEEKPKRTKYDWSQGGQPPRYTREDNPPSENQTKRLYTIASYCDPPLNMADVHDILRAWFGVESAFQITWKQYNWICNAIEDGLAPPVEQPEEPPREPDDEF